MDSLSCLVDDASDGHDDEDAVYLRDAIRVLESLPEDAQERVYEIMMKAKELLATLALNTVASVFDSNDSNMAALPPEQDPIDAVNAALLSLRNQMISCGIRQEVDVMISMLVQAGFPFLPPKLRFATPEEVEQVSIPVLEVQEPQPIIAPRKQQEQFVIPAKPTPVRVPKSTQKNVKPPPPPKPPTATPAPPPPALPAFKASIRKPRSREFKAVVPVPKKTTTPKPFSFDTRHRPAIENDTINPQTAAGIHWALVPPQVYDFSFKRYKAQEPHLERSLHTAQAHFSETRREKYTYELREKLQVSHERKSQIKMVPFQITERRRVDPVHFEYKSHGKIQDVKNVWWDNVRVQTVDPPVPVTRTVLLDAIGKSVARKKLNAVYSCEERMKRAVGLLHKIDPFFSICVQKQASSEIS
ncbi:hypothetical protein CcCBS67573_g06790 [Chytriomyces confervae]|uniref:Uncharacterized protein n=1 Tax=Chytriomyces confervae TaxID=246404 RepID=A0A507F0R2_9FUNG|nr:hypothetical protein CcCBS67573_g06790 [Chytriomyces confervae]